MLKPAVCSRPRRRVIWFADLEALTEDLDILNILRDELGLTTVAPESHICHTSGFVPSPEVVATSPLEGWRNSPTLRLHRDGFGIAEPAFAVLPGVVSGFDDSPLLRTIDRCRQLGLEVWGHAGLWCYGGEVFPDLAVRNIFGQPLGESSLPWGIGFCPSNPVLHEWLKSALADVARRYDLDGLFLDHARHTSPGNGLALLTCGCPQCEAVAATQGLSFDELRRGLLEFRAILAHEGAHFVERVLTSPTEWFGLLAGCRVTDWLLFRTRLLADRFADVSQSVCRAAGRPFEFGSDVFPPSVAVLGGHIYRDWVRGASFFLGGFGPKIGWSTVGAVTVENLSPWLSTWVPGLSRRDATRIVAHLIGYSHYAPDLRIAKSDRVEMIEPTTALEAEVRRIAGQVAGFAIYPSVSGVPTDPATLKHVCRTITEAGLPGAAFSGLERFDVEQRSAVREGLGA